MPLRRECRPCSIHSAPLIQWVGWGQSVSTAPVVDGSTLYGTANLGANGGGVVYSMNTDGSDYTVLHTFTTTASDGYQPLGSVVLSGSTLFGTTYFGGSAGGTSGNGTIFSVNTDGSDYTSLYSFWGGAGYKPYSTLTLSGSTLYGTTYYSSDGLGSVFSFDTANSSYTTLYNFTGDPQAAPDPWAVCCSMAPRSTEQPSTEAPATATAPMASCSNSTPMAADTITWSISPADRWRQSLRRADLAGLDALWNDP